MPPLKRSVGVALALGLVLFPPALRADETPHGKSSGGESTSAHADSAGAATPGGGSTVVKAKSELSAYSDSDAVSVFTPAMEGSVESPATGWTATGSYLIDIVSAASVDIVSTASRHWTEVRHAASVGGTYKPGTVGGTVSGSVSREPDYLSLTGGASLGLELAQKTANPTFGYSYAKDTAGRSDTPFSVYSQDLERHTLQGALELILDPLTLVSFSVDGIFESGDQKKPYRLLPMFSSGTRVGAGASIDQVNALRLPGRVSENLPLSRNRIAIAGRIAQRLSGSTLVLSERGYFDDWGLKASTTDLRFVVDMSRRVFLWAHLRAHVQSGVSFWKRAYVATVAPGARDSVPRLRTGDREMSPLTGGTFGAGARWNIGPASRPLAWSLVLQGDIMVTDFSDTLFIQSRVGELGVLQLEAEF